MEGNRQGGIEALATRKVLSAVAAILVGLGRVGQSLLIQIRFRFNVRCLGIDLMPAGAIRHFRFC
jgi:hypothetical protein